MRREFVAGMTRIFETNKDVVLLLGDIGVHGFSKLKVAYPNRVYNVGILEQSMVSMASGLAMRGFLPVIHTIAPFLIERALEQIKLDFAYQELSATLVTVGGSFDYSALGSTHHCPEDVAVMKTIPTTRSFAPSNALEFSNVLEKSISSTSLDYIRISEYPKALPDSAYIFESGIIKRGERFTLLFIGPAINLINREIMSMDCDILYEYQTDPLNTELLMCATDKPFVIVHPFYEGTFARDLISLSTGFESFHEFAFPQQFFRHYTTPEDSLEILRFTSTHLILLLKRLGKKGD